MIYSICERYKACRSMWKSRKILRKARCLPVQIMILSVLNSVIILRFFDHLASEKIILRFFGHLNFGDRSKSPYI
ncbi:unnamed protein product [Rhizophagus irregularis]|nr:unnamed protein product [Rhizophagus irregularis]